MNYEVRLVSLLTCCVIFDWFRLLEWGFEMRHSEKRMPFKLFFSCSFLDSGASEENNWNWNRNQATRATSKHTKHIEKVILRPYTYTDSWAHPSGFLGAQETRVRHQQHVVGNVCRSHWSVRKAFIEKEKPKISGLIALSEFARCRIAAAATT